MSHYTDNNIVFKMFSIIYCHTKVRGKQQPPHPLQPLQQDISEVGNNQERVVKEDMASEPNEK